MIPTERHLEHFVPREEVQRRVAALQAALESRDVASAWIDHLTDRLYFSGSAQDGVLLVPAAGPATFYVRKSRERARAEATVAVEPYPGAAALIAEVARAIGSDRCAGLPLDVTPASTFVRLSREIDTARIVDLTPTVRTLRAVKSPWEIEQIRRASDQVTALYGEIAGRIRPGIRELELGGHVEGRLRQLGHGGTVRVRRPGTDITMGVVVAGTSALYPTSFNGCVGAEGPYPCTASGGGSRLLTPGETLMLDLVTSHNGYHADTTRSFYLGRTLPDAVCHAHDFCREVLARIESRLRPGEICSEIYRDVSAWAAQRGEPDGFMGYGENRIRFFGHGVGLELDELPVLADKVEMALEVGSVLAVEPKAFLPGVGPVGVENTYVVTTAGVRKLSDADEALTPIDA